MRKFLKTLLEILDGTPAVYGKKQRGQSTVELALVSPLLVILIAGMVEIGWFARNYLVLLEVTRVAARTGTVQQNETSPAQWDINGSILPQYLPDGEQFSGDDVDTQKAEWLTAYRNCDETRGAQLGFYNFLACIAQLSLEPLPFATERDLDPGEVAPDDIVISAFAVQAIDPTGLPPSVRGDVTSWPLGNATDVQAIVVGRWPENANECYQIPERDPFEWVEDGNWTPHWNATSAQRATGDPRYFIELQEFDVESGGGAFGREKQRGFVWTGAHRIEGTSDCYGSEWGVGEIEALINLQQFNLDADQRRFVPSQGLVLVEMWWQHDTLSQFIGLSPVISPVFAILGADTVIEVWAVFPLPQVEPRIDFDQ